MLDDVADLLADMDDRDILIASRRAAGKRPTEIAIECDCSLRTVYNRMKKPAVAEFIKRSIADETRQVSSALADGVVQVIQGLLADFQLATPLSNERLTYARQLLEFYKDLREYQAFADKLEKALADYEG